MESRFIQLANTGLSDEDFFEEVFTSYIEYIFPKRSNFIQDLSRIRQQYNENDTHTHEHLRDKIEAVLYLHNILEHDTANSDKLKMKKKIENLEEQIEKLQCLVGRLESKLYH
jgi:phosphate uptake regulator